MEAEGIPVFVGEVAMGDSDWIIPEVSSVLRFRICQDQTLWFKENILNLLERIVPSEFDQIAWIDGDVWFQRLDWYAATEQALERYAVVQMCSRVVRTNEDGTIAKVQLTAAAAGSVNYGLNQTGMAWAARRELWTEAGGLYDRAIIGGGDQVMASAWLPDAGDLKWMCYSDLPGAISRQRAWAAHSGGCGSVDGTLWHEWHGDSKYRRYIKRHQLLRGLDVQRHLRKRQDGLLEWTEDAPTEIRAAIREYFATRREDGEANSEKS
jgi:hypothetical protein